MELMTENQQKNAFGGAYWKCQSSYHSGWKNNTFVSSWHGTWGSASGRRDEHVRAYTHATYDNTWITNYK